jgi:hypothetical protein
MRKFTENPKHYVISIRVNCEEKAAMDEMKLLTQKNISTLMREAMHIYAPYKDIAANRGS